MSIKIGNKKSKIYIGNTKVSKVYLGSTKIYSSGNVVTYVVRGVTYTQEYDEGESVLSPSVVTPALSGASFLGWSTSLSSTSVVSSLVMGDTPITLYAVFKYPDATVTSVNGNHEITIPLGGGDVTKTLYTLDTGKYASHTVTASVPDLYCGNPTIGANDAYAYVDGTLVRVTSSEPNSGPMTEHSGYIGTNGASFTLTNGGNLTIRGKTGGFFGGGRPCKFTIYGLKLNGKTVVG